MSDVRSAARPASLALVLIVTGLVGWISAFALTVDKILLLENPQADLDCNFSVIVQCGKNIDSWQGSVFGFPNSLLGMGGFVAPIAVGVALLAGARFAGWFWRLFSVGVTLALSFCIWLMITSIFALSTLCPWCMVVWAATILMFWTLMLSNARSGLFGPGAEKLGERLYGWVPVLTFGTYVLIAVVAQLRLDVLSTLI